jgi:hypothetical protein
VLIRRRDVRLRERKIGPYKYPTIDKGKWEERRRAINPEKQSTQNTTQKKIRRKGPKKINPKTEQRLKN